MARLSISTWSLHRTLGPMYREATDGSGRMLPDRETPGALTLLDLPPQLAARGIHTLEVCHFHFPRTDGAYLRDLRAALDASGIELFSLLVDAGDITHPDAGQREQEMAFVRRWIDIAGWVGAKHARVIGGDAEPSAEAIRLSATNLRALAEYARDRGVRVTTENFRRLTSRADSLLGILDQTEGQVGLCADFGNFGGETKYDELSAILPRADIVHAKADYPAAGQMRRDDFIRCLELSRQAGFDGPYSLIFDGPGEEWPSLAEVQREVSAYL
jgi:sugar phosphate isomerase/epimerase